MRLATRQDRSGGTGEWGEGRRTEGAHGVPSTGVLRRPGPRAALARAAASCYVSQPALSAAISKLERELDVSLIQRDRAFQGLTPEGERLVDWARRIIAERDALHAEAHAVRSGLTGTLRIGVVPTASTTVALPVEAFCAAHPRVTVRVRTRMSEDDIRRCLREFELDAAITYLDSDDTSGLSVEPLYRERYVLTGAPSSC